MMEYQIKYQITRRESKENQYYFLGYIRKVKTKKDGHTYIDDQDESYELKKRAYFSWKRKYYLVANTNFYVVTYSRIPIILIFLFVGLGAGIICGNLQSNSNIVSFINPQLESTTALQETVEKEAEKMIEVPGWGTQHLSIDQPYVYLINPKSNQVYFQYDILNGKQKLYSSKWIKPMQEKEGVPVNLYEKLEKGQYELIFQLSTYDLNTQVPQNGANIHVRVVVDK